MDNNIQSSKPVNKRRKKAAIIFVVIVLLLGIASGVALAVLDYVDRNSDDGPTNMYSDELHSYIFETPDYELDVTTVDEYMELDRLLYYKDGAEELGLSGNLKKYGPAVEFFEKYFETVIAGDTDKYNKLFTDHYYESNSPKNTFAPQMIYDMHIEKLWKNVEDNCDRYAFDVSYRIFRNNGTFRNDIDSGASKKLYFELVDVNGTVKIDRITYYK